MRQRQHGRTGNAIRQRVLHIYDTVHIALWASLSAALIMFAAFGLPQALKGEKVFEAQRAHAIESEDAFYCRRWGMAPGSGRHQMCMSDLERLRASVAQRLADDSDF